MPIADIGAGRTLYYERRGSGPPLLLIQGMAGHHRIWGEPLLGALAGSFDVVTYDHRGIGESPDVPGPFTTADLADDAAALLVALARPAAHVLGISLGGMVAQELVLGHPAQVRTLILGCTSAGGPEADLSAPGPVRMLKAMHTGNADTAIRVAYDANLSPGFTADDAHFAPFKHASLSVRVPVAVVQRQAGAAFAHDAGARLPTVSAPTLVLHGRADDMLRYSNGQRLTALIPGATLHPFAATGHLFWWEQPTETARLVNQHAHR